MDDKLDGYEYPEYRPSEKWSTKSYHMRLRTLNEVLTNRSIGLCDVLVLQEIEHEGVIADLLDRHLGRKGYLWYAVAKGEGLSHRHCCDKPEQTQAGCLCTL